MKEVIKNKKKTSPCPVMPNLYSDSLERIREIQLKFEEAFYPSNDLKGIKETLDKILECPKYE